MGSAIARSKTLASPPSSSARFFGAETTASFNTRWPPRVRSSHAERINDVRSRRHCKSTAIAAALAQALAELFIATGNLAMADRGSFRVALAGGNTPRAAYELLGREPLVEQLSWSDVFIYFGDERCVPPADEQSNYRMAQKAFLSSIPIPPANVHRIAGEIDPGHAANEYASILRADLGNAPHSI